MTSVCTVGMLDFKLVCIFGVYDFPEVLSLVLILQECAVCQHR